MAAADVVGGSSSPRSRPSSTRSSTRIGDRIREEIPDFRRLPAETLARAIRGNVGRALTALRDLRPPTDAELEQAAAVGRERAEQGLTVDAVLHAYRISVTAVWSRFGELARERGADVTSVLAFSETLWLWADAVMDVVGAAHREVELEQAREEQQRRDAFVLAAAHRHARRRRAAARERDVRARPRARVRPVPGARAADGAAAHRVALALAGDDGLVTALDHDLAGHRRRARRRRCRGSWPASARRRGWRRCRPRSRWPAARCRPRWRSARRARSRSPTSRSARRSSPTRRSATRSPPLPRAARRPRPPRRRARGRRCARGSTTGMRVDDTARALHVHPNTLRHRLRRFEEATGATLRDPRHLVELWWALERRRLAG